MYFIYVTTNRVNGKRYVGLCSKKKANWETYLGSGKILRKAISRYGSENFTREIISHHEKLQDAIDAERNFILENNCHLSEEWYNIAVGFTTQGFKGKKQTAHHAETMKKLLTGKPRSAESREKQARTRREKAARGEYTFYSAPRSEKQLEAARRCGLANRGREHKSTQA